VSKSVRLSWIAAGVVVAIALVIGVTGDPGAKTQQERVYDIAATLKCPQCAGESVAESDAAISRQIRAEIAEGLQEGKSADQIRADIAAGYDEDIRLDPTSEGVTGLVWVVPVVVFVVAGAGLVVVFRKWSRQPEAHADDADRELVEAALKERADVTSGGGG
jgi:cytochrome c-type biogenesis protein CcmH